MRHQRLNLVLLGLLLLLAGFNLLSQPRATRRLPNMPWTNMDRSAAAASFTARPAFADGKTQQSPVAGTVRVGETPLPYTADEADAARAGRELTNPLNVRNPRVIERGQWIFETYCATCHGPGMLGDGPVTRRGVPAPPSLLTATSAARPDGELYWILTYGKRAMPSYASQVEPDDRWSVIAYLRTAQREALR